jgi:large subunit ribosomal protein L32e
MAIKKRKHPAFLRPNYGRSSRSRIKIAWRRPRGIDNKKRMKIKYMGASPSIGYGQPSKVKWLHPSGLPEKLVQSPLELQGLTGVAIRIAGTVGRKKREVIETLAKSLKLKVLNPMHERSRDRAKKEKKAAIAAKEVKKADEAKKKAEEEAKKKAEDAKKKADDAKKAEEAKAAAAAKPAAPSTPATAPKKD